MTTTEAKTMGELLECAATAKESAAAARFTLERTAGYGEDVLGERFPLVAGLDAIAATLEAIRAELELLRVRGVPVPK